MQRVWIAIDFKRNCIRQYQVERYAVKMKAVILAGGLGTRISEESQFKPKPMIEIGGRPILWHIMKQYSVYGVNEFIICAGYKQNVIKEWFSNYFLYTSDITFDFSDNSMKVHNKHTEDWKVTIVDTGLNTQTGGRIKKVKDYVGNETFMLTYGDAVGNVNIQELLDFHKRSKKTGTISVYNFGQNKGVLDVNPDGSINAFREKSDMDGDLINIGYMVFEPEFFNYIQDDMTVLEKEPMSRLLEDDQLIAYTHKGFWQCMDTLREKKKLEEMWDNGEAPWKEWDD